MSPIVEIAELGKRIRNLRTERRLTLKQVETACGLSATHLSEIERGRTSPTIGALVRIARALGKDAAYFLEAEERDDVAVQMREDGKPRTIAAGLRSTSLSPGIPGGDLYAYRVNFDAGTSAAITLPAQDLPGDTVIYVQSGRIEARVGGQTLTLGPGDAVQASLGLEQDLRTVAGEGADIVFVSSRPLEASR